MQKRGREIFYLVFILSLVSLVSAFSPAPEAPGSFVNSSNATIINNTLNVTININSSLAQVCASNWTCTNYSACEGGFKSRTCIDSNNCFPPTDEPEQNVYCEEVIPSEPIIEETVPEPGIDALINEPVLSDIEKYNDLPEEPKPVLSQNTNSNQIIPKSPVQESPLSSAVNTENLDKLTYQLSDVQKNLNLKIESLEKIIENRTMAPESKQNNTFNYISLLLTLINFILLVSLVISNKDLFKLKKEVKKNDDFTNKQRLKILHYRAYAKGMLSRGYKFIDVERQLRTAGLTLEEINEIMK